ncbi:hypothetical protein Tco_0415401, partial [Tanacetum coccineum]
ATGNPKNVAIWKSSSDRRGRSVSRGTSFDLTRAQDFQNVAKIPQIFLIRINDERNHKSTPGVVPAAQTPMSIRWIYYEYIQRRQNADLGKRTCICRHCGAPFWEIKKIVNASRTGQPEYHKSCYRGTVIFTVSDVGDQEKLRPNKPCWSFLINWMDLRHQTRSKYVFAIQAGSVLMAKKSYWYSGSKSSQTKKN